MSFSIPASGLLPASLLPPFPHAIPPPALTMNEYTPPLNFTPATLPLQSPRRCPLLSCPVLPLFCPCPAPVLANTPLPYPILHLPSPERQKTRSPIEKCTIPHVWLRILPVAVGVATSGTAPLIYLCCLLEKRGKEGRRSWHSLLGCLVSPFRFGWKHDTTTREPVRASMLSSPYSIFPLPLFRGMGGPEKEEGVQSRLQSLLGFREVEVQPHTTVQVRQRWVGSDEASD